MIKTLRRIKVFYEVYNFFHYHKLRYQSSLYRKYGLKKRYYSSLSSKDFPEYSLSESPWLDKEDSKLVLSNNPAFMKLDDAIQSSIQNWSSNGFAILKGFFNQEKVSAINGLLGKLMVIKKLTVKDERKIMHAVRYSEEIKSLVDCPPLKEILGLLMGRPVELFQSVNFLKGSEDPAHSDFIHMSTYPYGHLLAVWIALEDIDYENGPVYYYPGSHKLPYVMNKHFDHGGNAWILGKEIKKNYAEAIEKICEEHELEKRAFTATKGDVLIWHANLLHGGSKVLQPDRTRKSMVLHYFGTDVIRYHEITQRPSLKP